MSGRIADKRRRIERTKDFASIVRTMKALAASRIGQYEEAVRALEVYSRTIALGLSVCFDDQKTMGAPSGKEPKNKTIGAVVFGTDLGLVGQFNEGLVQFTMETLAEYPVPKKIWVVGEQICTDLIDEGLPIAGLYRVPSSNKAVTRLVGELLLESQGDPFFIFQNRLKTSTEYEQVVQRILPLDEAWMNEMGSLPWVTNKLPEILPQYEETLSGLVREYLFMSIYKAGMESLLAENTIRLVAMQRAEKNIGEVLKDLQQDYHRVRQNSIDQELFDIISGFEALQKKRNIH